MSTETTTPANPVAESIKNNSGNNTKFLVILAAGLLGLIFCLIITVVIVLLLNRKPEINSFEDCAKHYPVLDSYPEQCYTTDGKHFVRQITPTPTPIVTGTTEPTITLTPSLTPTASPTSVSSTVKVFFAKDPSSYDDPQITVSVNRTTSRTDTATFAVEQLILGPTSTEEIGGLFSPVELSGSSNCSGKDFTLNIASGKATLKFCKNVVTAGSMDDARVKTVLTSTLKQFSTVSEVVLLDKAGNCFGDLSGMNLCL